MTPLGQFLFDLLMNIDIPFEFVDLGSHFVVFIQKLFGLFTLMLQFSGELMILQNS